MGVYKAFGSYRIAVERLAEQGIFLSDSGLRQIVRREKETGTVADRRRSGRPRKCGRRESRALGRIITRNRRDPFPKVLKTFEERGWPKISRWTVSRRLGESGFRRRVAKRVPLLNCAQKEKRLAFAKKYAKSKVSFWAQVIFTDEKMLESDNHRLRHLVTCRDHERHNPSCIIPTRKRNVQLHIWGAIGWWGVGPLRRIDGNLNAEKYQRDILYDVQDLCTGQVNRSGNLRRFLFQQDNAPAHVARSTQHFLNEKGVSRLPWPGNSPDFNPIENVWSDLAKRVRAHGSPASKEELWGWTLEEWDKTPSTFIRSLIRSLPRRFQEAVREKGGPTHY